jgi:cytochrome c oxidase assembly protein subunit 11
MHLFKNILKKSSASFFAQKNKFFQKTNSKFSNFRLRQTSRFFFSKKYQKPGRRNIDQATRDQQKTYWILNLGVISAVFGGCFLMIPLYKLFCQKVGIEGDLEEKTYSNIDVNKVNMARKFKVIFESESDPDMKWDFEPVTKEVEVHAGETALAFYRVYNKNDKPLIGISVYNINPEFGSNYFAKIQCFCFHQQMLNSKEEIFLPLYFYLEPEICEDRKMEGVSTIRINYKFFACRKQEIAEIIHQQQVKEYEQKNFLLEKRLGKAKKDSEKYKNLYSELEENRAVLSVLKEGHQQLNDESSN